MKILRSIALGLGYPLALVLILGSVAIIARLVQVVFFYSPPALEHYEQKLSYLESLPKVDPKTVPNFIVILFDDLGWGDLSIQGNALIRTPRIDQVASEGLRMNHFYSSSPVCTPSRMGLLSGRYPGRRDIRVVYFPDESAVGIGRRFLGQENQLARDEIMIPEALRAAGYSTGMIGKWHLGGRPGHRPTDFGFDSWYGVLWSNDMWPLHLFRNDEIEREDARGFNFTGERDEERPLGAGGIDQTHLTQDYTHEAIDFLERNTDRPFFLYLSHNFPHVPHYASPEHAGESAGGLYGDVVEDLDRSTGAVLDALERLNLDENTLVIITSDNGADYLGSPGGLRGRKTQVYEGGQRVPMIVRWPGRIPENIQSDAMGMNIDLFPTLLGLAGLPMPEDRAIDGRDLTQVMTANAASPHDHLFYFSIWAPEPEAVRDHRYKYLLNTNDVGRNRPHLSRLDVDIEAHDLRRKHPEVAEELSQALQAKRKEIRDNPRGWH
ncbi:MAG: sulfatase [bacterium]|nr:sulfatase [bacterium]